MRLGILERWVLGYFSIFLLLAGSNLYALVKLHQLGSDTIPGLAQDMRILTFQKRLVDSVLSQLRYERKFVVTKDEAIYNQFEKGREEFHRLLADVLSIADTPAKRDILWNLEENQKLYEQVVEGEAGLIREKAGYEQGQYRIAKDRASDAVLNELKRLEDTTRDGITMKTAAAAEAGSSSVRMALAASIATVFFALLASVFVARSITNPLKKVVTRTRDVSAGIFEGNLHIASPPEIAELNRAFNLMCEKLTAVDKMKGDFFSMVSHELRTPLTTISEGAHLLLEGVGGKVTEKQVNLLNILLAETNRLIRMVNSILDLSKMEAGMMPYAFERTHIGSLVEKALTEITPLLEAKKIILTKDIPEDLPYQKVDGERILQVLRNLIGNAVKFTPHGGRITIAGRPVEDSGVELSVEDTGPGIPSHKVATVFEKYSGFDHKSGTGLGLAIVKHIISAHGGRIWVESGNGRGSRFVFVLSSPLPAVRFTQTAHL